MTIALIDADIIAYQASASSQEDIDWSDGETGLTVDTQTAIATAKRLVTEWTQGANCKTPVLCFSTAPNFRYTVLPSYKSGRKDKPKPEAYGSVVKALEETYKTFRIAGLEADDVMGILSTSDRYAGAVVVTLDKDLQTVPCTLFRPGKDIAPRRIRVPMADRFWMLQTLMGDPTDGYSGCPSIGPKRAEAILADAGLNLHDQWRAVVKTYESKGLTEEDALQQARVARILRRTDYDKDNQEITLWHPSHPTTLSLTRLTTPEASRPTTTSSPGECPSDKETSSSTSPATKTKGSRSRTSRKPAGISTN